MPDGETVSPSLNDFVLPHLDLQALIWAQGYVNTDADVLLGVWPGEESTNELLALLRR